MFCIFFKHFLKKKNTGFCFSANLKGQWAFIWNAQNSLVKQDPPPAPILLIQVTPTFECSDGCSRRIGVFLSPPAEGTSVSHWHRAQKARPSLWTKQLD